MDSQGSVKNTKSIHLLYQVSSPANKNEGSNNTSRVSQTISSRKIVIANKKGGFPRDFFESFKKEDQTQYVDVGSQSITKEKIDNSLPQGLVKGRSRTDNKVLQLKDLSNIEFNYASFKSQSPTSKISNLSSRSACQESQISKENKFPFYNTLKSTKARFTDNNENQNPLSIQWKNEAKGRPVDNSPGALISSLEKAIKKSNNLLKKSASKEHEGNIVIAYGIEGEIARKESILNKVVRIERSPLQDIKYSIKPGYGTSEKESTFFSKKLNHKHSNSDLSNNIGNEGKRPSNDAASPRMKFTDKFLIPFNYGRGVQHSQEGLKTSLNQTDPKERKMPLSDFKSGRCQSFNLFGDKDISKTLNSKITCKEDPSENEDTWNGLPTFSNFYTIENNSVFSQQPEPFHQTQRGEKIAICLNEAFKKVKKNSKASYLDAGLSSPNFRRGHDTIASDLFE